MRSFVLLAFFVFLSVSAQDPWSVVDSALQKGIDTYGYPGCVAMVGDANVSVHSFLIFMFIV